jgi:hypothetical protein
MRINILSKNLINMFPKKKSTERILNKSTENIEININRKTWFYIDYNQYSMFRVQADQSAGCRANYKFFSATSLPSILRSSLPSSLLSGSACDWHCNEPGRLLNHLTSWFVSSLPTVLHSDLNESA